MFREHQVLKFEGVQKSAKFGTFSLYELGRSNFYRKLVISPRYHINWKILVSWSPLGTWAPKCQNFQNFVRQARLFKFLTYVDLIALSSYMLKKNRVWGPLWVLGGPWYQNFEIFVFKRVCSKLGYILLILHGNYLQLLRLAKRSLCLEKGIGSIKKEDRLIWWHVTDLLFTLHSSQKEHQKCWKDRLIWRQETDLKAPHGCLWIHRICLLLQIWESSYFMVLVHLGLEGWENCHEK